MLKNSRLFIHKLINRDDAHEFRPVLSEIEDSPTSPLGRMTFWIIIVLLTVTIAWLIIGKIDIVVTARGLIIPDGEAKIIQPLDTGVVSRILVQEGSLVKKGQLLMEIDPATTEPELNSIQANLKDLNLEIERLEAIANDKEFVCNKNKYSDNNIQLQTKIYQNTLATFVHKKKIKEAELIKLQEQIEETKKEKQTSEEILLNLKNKEARMKNVLDIIAFDEYDNLTNDIKNYTTTVSKLDYHLKELDSNTTQAEEDLEALVSEFKATNLQDFSDKSMQATKLKAEAEHLQFKNTRQKITAPCDGYIDKLYVHTIGGIVQSAQQLALLTPTKTPLLVKATVMNQDIGDIKEGMPVSIKIDAYNFQKYGTLKGKVKLISKNSINEEKIGQVYEVYVEPETTVLKRHNIEEQINTGMTVSAEIKVGQRRIIDFFIYPLIKYLDEGMSVK